ncbi:MAG TPA: HEAT repeat domain-containing protein [Vicinamibacterales bacterium]
MNRAITPLLLAIALAGAASGSAQGPEPGRRWALIVTGDREGARNGAAKEIAQILRRDYGYGADYVQELPGATRAALYAAFDSLGGRVRRTDSLFVYVAARTVSLRSKSISDQIMLVDSSEKEPWTVLDISELLDRLGAARAGATLLMLDSCSQVDWGYGTPRSSSGSSMASQSKGAFGPPIQVIAGCPPDSFGKALVEALATPGGPTEARRFGPKALAARMMDVRKELRASASGDGPFIFDRVEGTLPLSQLDRSNGPEIRQRAINDLVRTALSGNTANVTQAYAAIMKIALDRKDAPQVRIAAVRAMGLMGVATREHDLAAVIRDDVDPSVVSEGISALERLRTQAALAELEQLVEAPSAHARGGAIRALGRMESRGSLMRIVKRLSAEQDSDALMAGLEVLPVLSTEQNAQVVFTVLELLRRNNLPSNVEVAAVGVLGLLRSARAEPVLVARLVGDKPEQVRAAAAIALSSLDIPAAPAQTRESALMKALANDPSSSVRESAAFALGRLKANGATPALVSLLQSGNADARLRAAAAGALGEIGLKDALPALVGSLDDDSAHVRQAAAEALGKVGDRSALPRLRELQDQDKDNYVRVAAANAIRTLSNVGETIDEDLASSDPGRRIGAIGRLAKANRPDAAALIIKQLAYADPEVVAAAVVELSRMKADPTDVLVEELQRQDTSREGSARRRGAALALGARASKPAFEPLLAAARDKDLNVRSAVLAALANYDDPRVMEALREAETLPNGVLLQPTADALAAYGTTLYGRERLEDAVRAFESALRIHEQLYGSNDPQVAVDLNNLGVVLLRLGRTNDAATVLERALVIRERVLGASDPETATALVNLGLVHASQKDFAKAEPLYLRALRIRESVYGPDDITLASLLDQIAGMYTAMNRKSEADRMSQRAMAIRRGPVFKKH